MGRFAWTTRALSLLFVLLASAASARSAAFAAESAPAPDAQTSAQTVSAEPASPPGSHSRVVFKVVTLVLNVLGPGGAALAWMAARRRTNRSADLAALKAEIDIRSDLAEKRTLFPPEELKHLETVLNRIALPDRVKPGRDSGFMTMFGVCASASALCFILWFWQEDNGDPRAQDWWWMLVPAAGLAFLSLAALFNAIEGRRLILR
jgi:hypothetical protein